MRALRKLLICTLLAWRCATVPAGAGEDLFPKDEADRALARGAAFLVRAQRPNGAISQGDSHPVAMTSLAIMSLAAIGHQPFDATPEGRALARALEFVLGEAAYAVDGYLTGREGSQMYGHGITTLMLAEMLGMGVDEAVDRRMRAVLDGALALIGRSQQVPKIARFRGGWRYSPEARDADLSITVWQVMALRSARNAGLEVPAQWIESAAAHIRSCHSSPQDAHGVPHEPVGPFAYQPGGRTGYATTAAGVFALQVCGYYEDPVVAGGTDWLLRNGPAWNVPWFLYGTYYYAPGMHQRGGEHAAAARRAVARILLEKQHRDGGWEGAHAQERTAGRIYATSLAMLSLSVKYHYLPIYQR